MSREPDFSRYELADKLDTASSKLQSRMRGHFVDDPSVCTSCRNAHIYRQASKNRRHIYCSLLGKHMPDNVSECSEYRTINELTLHQMAEMATLIDPESRKVGFRGEP